MRRIVALLALVVCCLTAPARTQEPEPAAAAKACTWEQAEAVSVEEVTANFREWQGKCVRVKALHAGSQYGTGNRLLEDRMALLEDEEPHQRSIVLHPESDLHHEAHRPRWEEVLGTVGSCQIAYELLAEMQAADPDSFIMLAGLCHYTLDHYLVPAAVRQADEPLPVRLRRSDVRPEQVELRALPEAHPANALRRETGERMFAALEQADFEAFLGLTAPRVAQYLAEAGEAGLGEADKERLADARIHFEAAVSAFRAFGVGPEGGEVLLYERWREDEEDARVTILQGADSGTAAYVCRLGAGSEESDLPVHAGDIDNDPSRPFFCVHATDYVIYPRGTVPSADVPLFSFGFAESAD